MIDFDNKYCLLMAYYDKAAAGDFKKNFSGTWIGEHPTPSANQYLVLKFDFSGVDGGEGLIDNFIEKIKAGMEDFVFRYLPNDPQVQSLLDEPCSSPSALLVRFLRLLRSCKRQFYSDLVTPLPEKIDVPGTEIHIFYALKMGEKYRARYEQHFAHPVIHEQDALHEELLACYPQKWAQLVKSIVQ